MSSGTNKERITQNNAKIEELIELVKTKASGSKGEYFVRVIDYDGTVLDEQYLNTGDVYTLPASPPEKDRLIFQEWVSSSEIVDGKITIEDDNVMVGATYETKSGMIEFDIELNPAIAPNIETDGFTVTLNMSGNKYWNYANDQTLSDAETTHTYYAYGKYTIACTGKTKSAYIFGQGSAEENHFVVEVRDCLQTKISHNNAFMHCVALRAVNIGRSSSTCRNLVSSCYSLKALILPIGPELSTTYNNVAEYCYSLQDVVIPYGTTYIGYQSFSECYSLKHIIIPKTIIGGDFEKFAYKCLNLKKLKLPEGITQLKQTVEGCPSLEKIIIPKSVTSLNNAFTSCYCLEPIEIRDNMVLYSGFRNNYKLEEIIIPSATTSIASNTFAGCRNLKKVKLHFGVTRLSTNAFSECSSLEKFDMSDLDIPPTLDNTMFGSANKQCKFLVKNAEVLELFKASTNWATYADYFYIKE